MEFINGFNAVDWMIVAVIAVSVIYGLYRGFINGVLSLAALVASALLAFSLSGDLAAWLRQNKTLVDTLIYYTDAGSRISNLDLSLLPVSQVTESSLEQILQVANLPSAFETAFISGLAGAAGNVNIAQLLSQTIVGVSLSILSFLICFLIAYTVCTVIIHLISYVFELPVLRHLDSLVGGVFGLVRGVLLTFVLFALVPIVLAVVPVDFVSEAVAASQLAPYFDSRIILEILRGM